MNARPLLALLCGTCYAGCAYAQSDTAPFEGVWSSWLTTQEDTAWQVEDYLCFVGCPKAAYEHLSQLLGDPANDARPLDELSADTRTFITDWLRAHSTPDGLARMEGNAETSDANGDCRPYDFVRAVTNPLPVAIARDGATLTLTYEEGNRTRAVYLGDRAFPDPITASSLGYSLGHVDEDGALVIETRGLAASTYPPITINAAGGHSDQLHSIERYTVTPGDTPILTLELTLEDPVTLTAPYVYFKRWIATPDVELRADSCVPAAP
ncbi:MAG: hypothetical protein ACO1PZ_12045 [Gammaproteobacteria bacterium]